ncbi:hypothetical protein [Streptomyces sp. NPDC004435]|uniref:hypothetical protein n=1 Tax=Streptomyces sp. NPDC004435 TaxID=3364701 RepID=UPI0036842902
MDSEFSARGTGSRLSLRELGVGDMVAVHGVYGSPAVTEHLGFEPRSVEEGRIRGHVFVRGAWRDSVTYGILREEWDGTASRPR